MAIQSDIYTIKDGVLTYNPEREEKIGDQSRPMIKLGPEFQKVGDYMKRFATIPKILELDHLTVYGNVYFGRDITLKVYSIWDIMLSRIG